MLIPEDDFPLHQAAVPLAHTMDGHPNAYDRFWFNGYSEEFFFALALGLYPNRGVIDGAFSVVIGDEQYSVFASDALKGRPTSVGPISIDIIEPMRVNRIRVNAPEQGLTCDLTYTQRTAVFEEPRQTMYDGVRIFMDVTRATQLGTWSGWIETPQGRIDVTPQVCGTKDRSWGVRPVGEPLPGSPSERAPQLCFFWAPLNFNDRAVHFMTFNDANGRPVSRSGAVLPFGGDESIVEGELSVTLQPGTRWMQEAELTLSGETIQLTPIRRFQMRGAGYSHPQFAHGRWHGGLVVGGETLQLNELDPLEYWNIHIQTVVRASSAFGTGIGVVEQLVIGPYSPLGLTGILDGGPSDS